MERVFSVEGMSCQHCAMSVKKALSALPGIGTVLVDLEKKSVKVTYEGTLDLVERMKKAIEGAGYKVVS
jgi:copper chaperone